MLLSDWAQQWGIPPAAMIDLRQRLGIAAREVDPEIDLEGPHAAETYRQGLVRLEAPKHRVWLTRNNVGALMDERGIPVRYGLANESPAQNKKLKSADLIGIRPILIGPHHVGKVLGQFVSIEMKKLGWTYNPRDKHEVAQLNWVNFVVAKGGHACFATGPEIFQQQW